MNRRAPIGNVTLTKSPLSLYAAMLRITEMPRITELPHQYRSNHALRRSRLPVNGFPSCTAYYKLRHLQTRDMACTKVGVASARGQMHAWRVSASRVLGTERLCRDRRPQIFARCGQTHVVDDKVIVERLGAQTRHAPTPCRDTLSGRSEPAGFAPTYDVAGL